MINAQCPCMGKNFERFLQPHILMIVAERPMYGLEIIGKLTEYSMFSQKRPDPTGVYRYLKKMESSNLLSSDWKKEGEGELPNKYYAITPAGKMCMQNWVNALVQYNVDITELTARLKDCIGKT